MARVAVLASASSPPDPVQRPTGSPALPGIYENSRTPPGSKPTSFLSYTAPTWRSPGKDEKSFICDAENTNHVARERTERSHAVQQILCLTHRQVAFEAGNRPELADGGNP